MRLYFIIVFVLLTIGSFYAQKKDTLVRTFWNNGNQKTVTIYKLKRLTDSAGQTITILSDIKSIRYYKDTDDMEEERDTEISKREFDVLNRQRAEEDSIFAQRRANYRKKISSKTTQVFYMGKLGRFPIMLTIGDTAFVRCIKSHTVINGIAYPLQLDSTAYITPKFKSYVALGYLRNDSMSIYFYDLRLQNECVVADFNAVLKKAGVSFNESAEVAAKLSLKTAKELSNGLRKGATRGLAFILAEIIVTLAAP